MSSTVNAMCMEVYQSIFKICMTRSTYQLLASKHIMSILHVSMSSIIYMHPIRH